VKNLSIARRYAKALMLIAKEDGRAEEYRKELAAVAGLYKIRLRAHIRNKKFII